MNRRIALYFASFLLALQSVFAACTINGQEVPCSEFWAKLGWIFIVVGVIFLAVGVFWVWMLVDCIKRQFENKALWIIIILIAGALGAIVYYFVVKRKG